MIELCPEQRQSMVFLNKSPKQFVSERNLKGNLTFPYLNLNVLLTTFGAFVFFLPRLLPFVTLFVGVPLRLRDVVSVLLVLVKLIMSSCSGSTMATA